MPVNDRIRDGCAFVLAVVQGPLFILACDSMHLVYGAGAVFFVLWCALVLPWIILLSRNFRFVTWQEAVLSLALSAIGDNLRIGAIDRRELLKVLFVFWAVGNLLSSPVPTYVLLRSMTVRSRLIFGFAMVLAGVVLWLGVKRITG